MINLLNCEQASFTAMCPLCRGKLSLTKIPYLINKEEHFENLIDCSKCTFRWTSNRDQRFFENRDQITIGHPKKFNIIVELYENYQTLIICDSFVVLSMRPAKFSSLEDICIEYLSLMPIGNKSAIMKKLIPSLGNVKITMQPAIVLAA